MSHRQQLYNDETKHLAGSLFTTIMRQREAILAAFIAETGLKPWECEQVQQGNRWFVRKREDQEQK